ncbi:S66 family peptidase [Staphylococcus succinus]|uniref:S66 family peptidase n=1 Tax=Staphylococcus succinus TaxID=61015 RepID=UPI000D1D5AE4|nr:S66 peptidase family protein [Staphylococcus succinus]MBU0437470.1 LD-carboxypeptidase [Staphylococcus succinus]PTI47738.1 LD-carboxypeptidase [Staphylococcus succinus]PTJ81944.1 LD-carboxypeptidase [Staphylococcus succinus]
MIKPMRLQKGDTVAIVSLSSGLAGEDAILWRTYQGVTRLQNVFGLNVKVMPNALKGIAYIRAHPEQRAADLNDALRDDEVKAIISCIGGDDAIRIAPYVDFKAIRKHPKIFIGYSDTTSVHMMFYKMGIVSFYGPALLTDFAENIEMDAYTIDYLKKCLFYTDPINEIMPALYTRMNDIEWKEENKNMARTIRNQGGYELLCGEGIKRGHLIGGNLETFVSLLSTNLFPDKQQFKNAILFLETSEDTPTPQAFADDLTCLLNEGVLEHLNGIIVGKPFNNLYYTEYKAELLKIIEKNENKHISILFNLSFGHCEPKHSLPYGVLAEINCSEKSFEIIESSVVDG